MPHEKTSAELLAEGDAYCQVRQFERANAAYLAAFESSSDSKDVTPLDKAAACYLRVEDYSSALALTKKMSKLNAGDVRVYLRMGQTLQLLQKPALATKIYAKGLQRCRITADGYDILRKQHSLLESRERATKSEDPVRVLPFEIVDQIMGYLDFKCRVNLLRVSKKWREHLISNSSLWRDMDLSLARRPVSRSCISNYIKWSKGRMHTAKLKRISKSQSLWELSRQCQITSLSLLGGSFAAAWMTHPSLAFKSLQCLTITKEEVTLDSVQVILKQVPSLVSLDIHQLSPVKRHATWDFDMPNLQHLRIHCVKDVEDVPNRLSRTQFSADKLIERIPNIRTLEITPCGGQATGPLDFSRLLYLETMDFEGNAQGPASKLPAGLRNLCLTSYMINPHDAAPRPLPNLESLALGRVMHRDQPVDLEPLLLPLLQHPSDGGFYEPGHSPLRRLALSPSPSLDQWKQIMATPRLEKLEEIEMIELRDINESSLCELVTAHLPHLKRLKIEASHKLTGWGVKQLVTGLSQLEELVLSECPLVQFDAIDWARKKVKLVGWMPMQESKSGKKVLWG